MSFETALQDIASCWPAFVPPNRVPVHQGAADLYKIARPGGGAGAYDPWLTPYMIEPMDTLASRLFEAVCFAGPAQSGKALDVRTRLPTPTGWTTMGAVKVGDLVIDRDGVPTEVVFATEYQHGRQCFEVTFSDLTSVIADADHLWVVERFYWKRPTWREEVLTTEQMRADLAFHHKPNGVCRFRYRVKNAGALQLPPADLPIDPYLLGVWLGDGSAGSACISVHEDDVPHIKAAFEAAGHTVAPRRDKGNVMALQIDPRGRLTTHCQRGHDLSLLPPTPAGYCRACSRLTYHRKLGRDVGPAKPPMFADTFTARLRALGVHGNKHVPGQYLRASEEQRWQLLRGLMDTDGTSHAVRASAEFTTTSQQLRDGFLELACSLGLKPTCRVKDTTWTYRGERKRSTAFRISFPMPPGARLFNLPRKASRAAEASTEVGYRQIVSIVPVPSRPVKCIQVAAESHTYLAGDRMIPTHNTAALLEGFLAHVVANDPGDMLITQMTQDKAREYSRKRIDRMFRHSPDLAALMGPSSKDDNLHDKTFRNGMQLKIGWPTATNFASTEYRYTLGTDYDRWADNIDNEGDGFTLQGKRSRTFLSRGMNGVESSPGRPVTDPHWQPETPHEAPPVTGILGIYNRSDRRRWYWPCPHCGEFMQAEPGLGLFRLPSDDDLLEGIRSLNIDAFVRDHARVICPANGCIVRPEHRDGMNKAGIWLPDGVSIDARRRLSGDPRKSSIAGFWLGGVAATYQLWPALIRAHLQGLLEYALTGSELPLQTTANTDQGIPYTSRHLIEAVGTGKTPKDRATENWEQFTVPEWTRFVLTSVDVQGGKNARFIVQTHAIGEHQEQRLVARYAITESNRDGYGGKAPLDPAAHAEDWDVLNDRVVRATYRTPDGREIRTRLTLVDTGGEDGVTERAYRWWRSLKRLGLHRRVKVIKGEKKRYDWLVRESMVGGPNQTKGDVPLQLLNASLFKDMVNNGLKRQVPGPNYYHFPMPWDEEKNPDGWLLPTFFDELNAETRNADGTYTQHKKRNEALDCCYMIRAGCVILGADKASFWQNPPSWALPLDQNSDVIDPEERRAERAAAAPVEAGQGEQPKRGTLERRSRRSSYLGG